MSDTPSLRQLGAQRRAAYGRIKKLLEPLLMPSGIKKYKSEDEYLKIYAFDKRQVIEGMSVRTFIALTEDGVMEDFNDGYSTSVHWQSICLEDLLKLEKLVTELKPRNPLSEVA